MNILISACLLGTKCRYDGKEKCFSGASKFPKDVHLIPVCPEQLGGLPTPRPPAERRGDRVYNIAGRDVTEKFLKGAEEVLKLAEFFACKYALLKEKSPSCGKGRIHDGSFKGNLIAGDGVTAETLSRKGIKVFGESKIEELLEEIKNHE